MNKKQKVFLGVVLLLLVAPMAGMMMAAPDGVLTLDNTPLSPNKSYEMSASSVLTAADTVVTNLDDTDNLYGGAYRSYTLVVNCSDADGVADIKNVTVSFGGYFSFRWSNFTGLVTVVNGSTYITKGTSSNTTTASGDTLNLTIAFEVEWAMTDVDNVDITWQIWDDGALVKGTLDKNYDIDTDLTVDTTDFVTTGAKTSETLILRDTVISYEDSGGNNYPLAAETDFLMTRTPATGGTDSWSEASYSDSTGIATWASVSAGYIAQQETFTLTTYTQSTTTTNLFGEAKTDVITIANSGGGGGDDDSAVDLLDLNTLAMIGLVGIGGYLVYTLFFTGTKSKSKGRSKSKRKTKKKKSRRR